MRAMITLTTAVLTVWPPLHSKNLLLAKKQKKEHKLITQTIINTNSFLTKEARARTVYAALGVLM